MHRGEPQPDPPVCMRSHASKLVLLVQPGEELLLFLHHRVVLLLRARAPCPGRSACATRPSGLSGFHTHQLAELGRLLAVLVLREERPIPLGLGFRSGRLLLKTSLYFLVLSISLVSFLCQHGRARLDPPSPQDKSKNASRLYPWFLVLLAFVRKSRPG